LWSQTEVEYRYFDQHGPEHESDLEDNSESEDGEASGEGAETVLNVVLCCLESLDILAVLEPVDLASIPPEDMQSYTCFLYFQRTDLS
jgi:hypothetical protein